MRPVVWAIGGIDPSGGAGLYQDLRVMEWAGVHPMGIPTSLTAQNIGGVQGVLPVEPDFFLLMAKTLLERHPPAAVKIGLLPEPLVSALLTVLASLPSETVVAVDPIVRFGSGDPFLETASFRESAHRLFQDADLVFPNAVEAEVLLGEPVVPSREGILAAARTIVDRYGPRAVYLKGGHIPGPVRTDVFVNSRRSFFLDEPEVSLPALHGGGCTLGSLLVSALALHPKTPPEGLFPKVRKIFQEALLLESSRPGDNRRTLEAFFSRGMDTEISRFL